jgi:hypothetical protein
LVLALISFTCPAQRQTKREGKFMPVATTMTDPRAGNARREYRTDAGKNVGAPS